MRPDSMSGPSTSRSGDAWLLRRALRVARRGSLAGLALIVVVSTLTSTWLWGYGCLPTPVEQGSTTLSVILTGDAPHSSPALPACEITSVPSDFTLASVLLVGSVEAPAPLMFPWSEPSVAMWSDDHLPTTHVVLPPEPPPNLLTA